MPLDPSIISQGITPYKAPDLAAIQGQQLTLANLGLQNQAHTVALQQAQQEQAQTAQLNDLYKGNINPDGTINRTGLYGAVAAGGLGSRLPAMQKNFADTDKATADAQAAQLKVHVDKVNAVGDRIASLLANPAVNHDQVVQSISSLVQDGTIDPQTGAGMVQAVPGDPAALRQWLVSKGLEAHADSSRMAMLLPKITMQTNGKVNSPVDMNPITNPAGPQPITMQTTPGEDQTAASSAAERAVQLRGQNITDSRERALAQNGVTYQQDGNGNFVALPTKAAPGAPVTGAPVVGPNGQPLQGNKNNLNSEQANALMLGNRAKMADSIMTNLAMQGVDKPGLLSSSGGLPLVGGAVAAAGNFTASPQQQQVQQAQRDFVNAVLRKESGAAISQGEFDSAAKQYFPQRGDSPQVIAQKAANRQAEIQGLLAGVPQQQRGAMGGAPAPAAAGLLPGAAATPQINFAVPDDVAAILKKHGAQ